MSSLNVAHPEDTGSFPGHSSLVSLVRDVMLHAPKTLPADASVEDARAALADDHVHMVLLTVGETLRGTVLRTDLGPGLVGTQPVLPWSRLSRRTVDPHALAETVQELLIRRGLRRLAVVDADLTLRGLVCLKRSRSGFCSDADVASRAAAPHRPAYRF